MDDGENRDVSLWGSVLRLVRRNSRGYRMGKIAKGGDVVPSAQMHHTAKRVLGTVVRWSKLSNEPVGGSPIILILSLVV